MSDGFEGGTTFALGDWFRLVIDKNTKTAHLKITTSHPVSGSPIQIVDIEQMIIDLEEEPDD